MTKPPPRYHLHIGHRLLLLPWPRPCISSPNTYPSSSCAGGLKFWRPGATNRCSVPVERADIVRQVTSGSERRICSRSRRLKTIDHRSIHQQRMAAPLLDARAHPNTRFDAQICNSPPTSPVDDQIDCNGHNTHNFGPPNPQQQFMGSCKQKQCTNVSVSCNNMARSVHIKSTLSYFLSTWPAAGSMLQIDHHIGNQLTEGRNRAVYTYRCFGSMAVNASELFWFCCSPMTNYDNYAILRRF